MKNYKIWILFILLSVVSFGAGSSNSGIGLWIYSIGFNSTDNELNIILESRTGEKFEDMAKLILTDLVITNGFIIFDSTDAPSGEEVVATRQPENDTVENPKILTKWYVNIPITSALVNEVLEIKIGDLVVINNADGNQNAIEGKYEFGPFSLAPNDKTELKIYEKLSDDTPNWMNNTTEIEGEEITVDGYIFTKGGLESFEDDPGVYALISTDGGAKIGELKIKRNGGVEEILTLEDTLVMRIGGFEKNKKNTVTVTPISVFGIEGSPVTLDFVVDTEINTSYLEGGIIGELDSDGKIIIELSKLIELSGVTGYSYSFKVENKTISNNESNLDGESFTTPIENSITGTAETETTGFIEGSKGILLFTVYDKLGHEKTFEKTYFIPKELDGITAKVSDEAKQRKSKIKVVTDGSSDKFELESSVDKSSE